MSQPRSFRSTITQANLVAPIFQGRTALATTDTTGTLSVPQTQAGLLAVTPAQAITLTLPTASLLFAWLGNSGAADLTIANVPGTGSITLAAGTGGTLYEVVANGEVITSGSRTMLRIQMTSDTTYDVFLTKFIAV